jgi:hypothetical protein
MSRPDAPSGDPSWGEGSTTAVEGTPFAVDVSRGRARAIALVLLAGPIIWSVHFMLVYLVAEAGCSGDGPGLELFDPPVPTVVTLAATAVAAIASLLAAAWAHRRWRAGKQEPAADEADDLSGGSEDFQRGGSLAFAGFLLSLLSFVTVLLVGLPALLLPAC